MAVLAACASAPQALSVQQPRRQAGPQQQWRPAVAAPRRPAAARRPVQSSASGAGQQAAASVPFPEDYAQAVRQAGDAVKAALADGAQLVEVEFPTSSLAAVAGDAEGANEMTQSMQFLRQFMRAFQQEAASTRIFFPDNKELNVARRGKGMDPAAGSWDIDPVFETSAFKFGYLMKPNAFLDMGITIGKHNAADQLDGSEELLVAAYPSFNPQEMLEVGALHDALTAAGKKTPIVTFNGELDRIRTGYYPPLFYPKIGQLAKTLLPRFTTAYYLKNFKGASGGAVFRCYPGPYQIYSRTRDGFSLVEERPEMPSLREVSLEVLPKAAAAKAKAAAAARG